MTVNRRGRKVTKGATKVKTPTKLTGGTAKGNVVRGWSRTGRRTRQGASQATQKGKITSNQQLGPNKFSKVTRTGGETVKSKVGPQKVRTPTHEQLAREQFRKDAFRTTSTENTTRSNRVDPKRILRGARNKSTSGLTLRGTGGTPPLGGRGLSFKMQNLLESTKGYTKLTPKVKGRPPVGIADAVAYLALAAATPWIDKQIDKLGTKISKAMKERHKAGLIREFDASFKEARNTGKDEFTWRGKRYHTRLA